MLTVRNEDIELLMDLNKKLNDDRIAKTLERWLAGRELSREETRKRIAEKRKVDKNYARKKN